MVEEMMTVGDSQTMITMAVEGIGVCGQRNKGKVAKKGGESSRRD